MGIKGTRKVMVITMDGSYNDQDNLKSYLLYCFSGERVVQAKGSFQYIPGGDLNTVTGTTIVIEDKQNRTGLSFEEFQDCLLENFPEAQITIHEHKFNIDDI